MAWSFDFNSIPRTTFAQNSSVQLPAICKSLAIQKPLIVTDRGIVGCGLLEPVLKVFSENSITTAVYADVSADPPESNIFEALSVAQSAGCDGVIGFGGGSSMDVAKLLALLLNTDQPLSEMYGVELVKGQRLPLIQVPTTSGTGAEATAVAVITTGESSKAGVVSKVLFADHIVLDPNLTLGLPPHVTAATGIDAMVHAIEAYTSRHLKNPLSDMLASKALQLLSENIETAVKEGNNMEARGSMLLGAMLAGQAFANAPVAGVHALAYPLGGSFHIPHGLSNALVLPHVIRFNSPSACHMYMEIAKSIHGIDTTKTCPSTIGETLAEYFHRLSKTLGLQTRLQEMNIARNDLPSLAEQAMLQQRLLVNNPREITYDDALSIYQQAF